MNYINHFLQKLDHQSDICQIDSREQMTSPKPPPFCWQGNKGPGSLTFLPHSDPGTLRVSRSRSHCSLDSAIGLTLVHSGGPGNGSFPHLTLSRGSFLSRTSTRAHHCVFQPFCFMYSAFPPVLGKMFCFSKCSECCLAEAGAARQSCFCRCPPVSK